MFLCFPRTNSIKRAEKKVQEYRKLLCEAIENHKTHYQKFFSNVFISFEKFRRSFSKLLAIARAIYLSMPVRAQFKQFVIRFLFCSL